MAARVWVLPLALGLASASEAALVPQIAGGSAAPALTAAAMALPLAWRAGHPLAALAGTMTVFGVHELYGSGTLSEAVMPFVVLMVAMYAAASRLRGVALAAGCGISCLVVGGTIVLDGGLDVGSLIYAALVILAAFATGRLIGQRTREARRLVEERTELFREREERERAAVARERMRIAQELHDLITHRVSAMVLQASAERRITERDGGSTIDVSTLIESLQSIENLGREAMHELRQLLGALFHEDADARTPPPRTADLAQLVTQTSGAGVTTQLEVLGAPRELPPAIEVSLYRLAQEALANAMRHAPGSHVSVRLEYTPEAVELVVANTAGAGAGPEDHGLGLGIPGMRERARQFGGTLEATPAGDDGFLVRARLPALDEHRAEHVG